MLYIDPLDCIIWVSWEFCLIKDFLSNPPLNTKEMKPEKVQHAQMGHMERLDVEIIPSL